MNQKIIILLGAPGAGKGTQAKLLQKEFDLNYIGSGDLLRARKKLNDFTGTKIGQVIDRGERVPTPVIFKLWMDKFEEFKTAPKFKGILIDGSPRTILEADMIEQALEWYEWTKNKRVILVDISTKEVIQRLTKRRMCEQCGRIVPFVGEFKKIKECNKCGGKLITRADDDEKGVKKRLEWFETEVKPAINYYEERGELIKINGEQSIEDVFKDILKVLK